MLFHDQKFSVEKKSINQPKCYVTLNLCALKDDKEPAGLPFLHMNYDAEFKWDTKDDANDKDNGFICKKAHNA